MKNWKPLIIASAVALAACGDKQEADQAQQSVLERATQAAKDAASDVADKADAAADAAGEAMADAADAAGEMADNMSESATDTMDAASDMAESATVAAGDMVDSAKDATADAMDSAAQTASAAADNAQAVAADAVDAAKEMAADASAGAAGLVASATQSGETGTADLASFSAEELQQGESTYRSNCAACHATGAAGAPKLDDKANWAPRIAQGMDTMVKHAIEGFTGSQGVMPPKGGFTSLADDDVKAAVAYMASQAE